MDSEIRMPNYDVKFNLNDKNHCWTKAIKYIGDNTSILDVGCSKGDFGRGLREYKGCVVDGIEPDQADFKEASKHLHKVHHGLVENVLKDELKNQKYDHITCMDVIEHLYSPVQVLELFKSILKPEGSVVFSIPNMSHISVRMMLLEGKFEYGETGLLDNTHLHFYTREEIEKIFNEAGYKVTNWDHTEASYPEELIRKKFSELGFKLSEKAMDLLREPSASIFQYVGSAEVSTERIDRKRTEYSPDPQGEISKMYEQKIEVYKTSLRRQDEEKQNLNSEIQKLNRQLEEAKSDNYIIKKIPPARYIKIVIKNTLKKLKNKFAAFK